MPTELKSGSVILSPEDAKLFEELKEFQKEVYNGRFIIQNPSLWEDLKHRSVYFIYKYNPKIEYSESDPEKIIQKLQKSNDELTEMISKLITRSLWGRIINKY